MFRAKSKIILFKFIIKLWKMYGKCILTSVNNHFFLLGVVLKKSFLKKYGDRTISYINELTHVICLHFLHEKIPENYTDFFQKESKTIKNEIGLILKNAELKKIISNYYLILSFYYSFNLGIDELESRYNENLRKAQKYCRDAAPLTRTTFGVLNKEIRKKYKEERKEYSKQLREFLKNETYGVLPKIDISLGQITYLLGLASSIFLLTGYIYNKFFLGFYGIEVSKFFSLTDYLSASVDKLYIACVGGILGVGFYIKGMYDRLKEEVTNIHFGVQSKKSDYQIFILIVVVSISTISAFYFDMPSKYSPLSILIFFALMGLYYLMPTEKFFKNHIYISIFFVAFIYFAVNIFWAIMDDREKIKKLGITELKKYNVTLYEGLKLDTNPWILIARTSEYCFFYDKRLNKSFIIPKESVKYFEIIKK